MTMPLDLVLVRHGESEGNIAFGRSRKGDNSCYTPEFLARHSSRWRLTDTGREQARLAGLWLRENLTPLFDRYYASEYLRAMETAAMLAFPAAQWRCEFYLREREWGMLDQLTFQERRERYALEMDRRELDTFFWTPPGGESMADLCLRVDRVMSTLHRECFDKRVLVVCHGEVMWAFRVRLERLSQGQYHALDTNPDPKLKMHNCQVLHYTRRDPATGLVAPYLGWVRSVCPWDLDRSANEWQAITRATLTNEEMLQVVGGTPCLTFPPSLSQ